MIKIQTVVKDAEGNALGGVDFYWDKGADICLYQKWEHMAAGRVWQQVCPDPMSGTDFVDYIVECWPGYTVVEVTQEYR